jgi:hypothetical protein
MTKFQILFLCSSGTKYTTLFYKFFLYIWSHKPILILTSWTLVWLFEDCFMEMCTFENKEWVKHLVWATEDLKLTNLGFDWNRRGDHFRSSACSWPWTVGATGNRVWHWGFHPLNIHWLLQVLWAISCCSLPFSLHYLLTIFVLYTMYDVHPSLDWDCP